MKTDLSITRIAGLTWNEWNARLAMPLVVTQLREGVHPLVFPTDLSMEKGAGGNAAGSGSTDAQSGNATKDICKIERQSPLKRPSLLGSPIPSNNDLNEEGATSTPLNCSAASDKDKSQTSGGSGSSMGNGGIKIKHFTEEEATALMLKAAAEKSAAAAGNNNSENLSDNSYTDEMNNSGNTGPQGGGSYHSSFADMSSGISLNILNSINAMSNLISGGGAGGNGGLSLAGAAALGMGGPGNGAGHPCPECGRIYKLKSSLRNHQKWECGKEPQFQCPFCVYRAKQKMHIGRHMERMHKEKFFKVEDLKSFTTATVDAQLAGSTITGIVSGTTGGGGAGGGSGNNLMSGGANILSGGNGNNGGVTIGLVSGAGGGGGGGGAIGGDDSSANVAEYKPFV